MKKPMKSLLSGRRPQGRSSALFAAPMLAGLLLAGCASNLAGYQPSPPAAAESRADMRALRQVLAPTGKLRVAMYRGSPSSYVQPAATDAPKGVAFDLGQAFAQRLGVPFEPLVFPKNDDAIKAVRDGQADFAFTNASPERSKLLDFTPPVLDVEKSVLVPPNSPYRSLESLAGQPVRIGVSIGSTTASELATSYPQAQATETPTLGTAVDWLRTGRLDGFATNKAILYELSDQLPGSTVLPGRTGTEHFAIGIPHGRDAGRDFVDRFALDAQADGTVARAVARAGLRGTVAPAMAAR